MTTTVQMNQVLISRTEKSLRSQVHNITILRIVWMLEHQAGGVSYANKRHSVSLFTGSR